MPSRRELANMLRALAMDAVQKAHSGHPGMPMGMADIAEVLWNDFLKHNPQNPHWANRDRFVISNGHGSMLLYALLHLTGYDLPMDELRRFRQLHSKTPGHPEFGETPGVETTTGPLGQGLANAVGMAIAEKHLAAEFNRPGFDLIDHDTFVFVGDGCLMEGISHEACSLAGTLGLGKLTVFYDDNQISIDGDVRGWFTDNTPERFRSYGWHVIPDIDGHDSEAVRNAILAAKAETRRPTLICCKTTIAFGSPNRAGTSKAHGEPLGEDEVAATRKNLGWTAAPFEVPDDIRRAFDARQKGAEAESRWQALFQQYAQKYPDVALELQRRVQNRLPENWATVADAFPKLLQDKQEAQASRKASEVCINHFASHLPELMGGSADLTGSNLTHWKDAAAFTADNPAGQYIFYGVREFGMSAIMNGLALHGGILPFGGTFLTFSDYARNAVRLAALMQQRVIFIYTHDSIGLGEDGPTHQPVEHLPSLRLIPGLAVWRPCDSVETAVAWQLAIERSGPTCLALSRQNLPCEARSVDKIAEIRRGGYILRDCEGHPELILIATGSEVSLAMAAASELAADGTAVRVVSMPSAETFLAQDEKYQQKVLPESITARVIIEAAASAGWYRFSGAHGRIIGLDRFGYSAPGKDVFAALGFTKEAIVKASKELLSREEKKLKKKLFNTGTSVTEKTGEYSS